jgi:malate synthase
MDAMFTADRRPARPEGLGPAAQLRAGSVYIVKPKMHGPDEVSFTVDLFSRVEDALGLDRNTLKLGIMDEERRTTVNLKECIRRAASASSSSTPASWTAPATRSTPAWPRAPMTAQGRHEDRDLDHRLRGLERGCRPRLRPARPRPDRQGHVGHAGPDGGDAGAEGRPPALRRQLCLGAVAHRRDAARHCTTTRSMSPRCRRSSPPRKACLSSTTSWPSPCADPPAWSAEEIQRELDNNAQGILGYVVRWVEQGVGCSKVPDINDVGLMEDRATLRISSQHIANWLHTASAARGRS